MNKSVIAISAALLLSGCSLFPHLAIPSSSQPSATPTGTPSAPASVTPSISKPTESGPPTSPGTPGTSGKASTPATKPARPAPSVPSGVGALDVSAYPMSSFASPSGRIWCGTDGKSAYCHFPKGMTASVPSSDSVCPGEGLDVTGVRVAGASPVYFCSGDPVAFPAKKVIGQVDWHAGTTFPWVNYDGFTLAVLPYGKKMVSGKYLCVSEEIGVTCANTSTKHGFRMSLAGPEFF